MTKNLLQCSIQKKIYWEKFLLILCFYFICRDTYAHDFTFSGATQTLRLENNKNVKEEFKGTPYSASLNINPLKMAFRPMAKISYEKISLLSSEGSSYKGATTRVGGGLGLYNLYFLGLIGIGKAEITKEKKVANYNITSGLFLAGWEFYMNSKIILRSEVQYEIISISGKKNDNFGEVYLGNSVRFSLGLGYVF